MSGVVYFIAAEPLSAVKIGFTAGRLQERLRNLQIGCPAPLKIMAYVEGSVEDEADLHAVFHALRIHGEWFRLEGLLKYLIEHLAHGQGMHRPSHRALFDVFVGRLMSPNRRHDHELLAIEKYLGCLTGATE